MLLVKPPDKRVIFDVVNKLANQVLARNEVYSWQQAVFAQCRFKIPVTPGSGYWYFYSLMYVTKQMNGEHFLRQKDFEEYRQDLQSIPGRPLVHSPDHPFERALVHLRLHQVDHNQLRWPLALIHDSDDLMSRLPSARGIFERHLDMLEHCHIRFGGVDYLLVKQFDEASESIMVLGSNRDTARLKDFLAGLAVTDYILP